MKGYNNSFELYTESKKEHVKWALSKVEPMIVSLSEPNRVIKH